ncbi:hypothetical protein BJY00DRAFT_280719 [Aspergillus carlsbadensis]|nr:hypothetical protein BJY00DRAFT_280719 [Aspergillus carlsbadensis]
MGHKVSAVAGVKSENFTDPGNAINEIWAGNTEVISRLPFGDSDMAQAGWPENGMPKIPWHNFIIPMKRDLSTFDDLKGIFPTTYVNWTTITQWPADKLICCNKLGCMADNQTTDYMFTKLRINQDPTLMVVVFILSVLTLAALQVSWKKCPCESEYDSTKRYDKSETRMFLIKALSSTAWTMIGLVLSAISVALWVKAHYVYELKTRSYLLYEYGFYIMVIFSGIISMLFMYSYWCDWMKVTRGARRGYQSVSNEPSVENPDQFCSCRTVSQSDC